MPLTEEIASSSGRTTPVMTSSGVAPGNCTFTLMVAGSALGNRSTAKPRYENTPRVTRNAMSITVNTGYLTQVSASFMVRSAAVVLRAAKIISGPELPLLSRSLSRRRAGLQKRRQRRDRPASGPQRLRSAGRDRLPFGRRDEFVARKHDCH